MPFLASFLKNNPKTDRPAPGWLRSGIGAAGLLLLTCFWSAAPASAQTVTKVVRGTTTTPSVTPFKQGVIIRNGVPVQLKGEATMPVTQTITFPNGTTLQPNGLYTTTDGKHFQLQEGDRIDERGVMQRMPVKIEESVTVSGDTTALGAALQQAQADQEYLQLLQRKRALLEEKSKLLDGAAPAKAQSADLKKIDADIAQVKAELTTGKSGSGAASTSPTKKTSPAKKAPAAKKPATRSTKK